MGDGQRCHFRVALGSTTLQWTPGVEDGAPVVTSISAAAHSRNPNCLSVRDGPTGKAYAFADLAVTFYPPGDTGDTTELRVILEANVDAVREDNSRTVDAALSLPVPAPVWTTLLAACNDSSTELSLSFPAPSLVVKEWGGARTRIPPPDLRLTRHAAGNAAAVVEPAADFASAALGQVLDAKQSMGSQLHRVASELALSCTRYGAAQRGDRDFAASELADFIGQIRSAFHERYVYDKKNSTRSAFDLRPAEFVTAIAALDEAEQKSLRASYDSVWRHVPLTTVVSSGEERTELAKSHLACATENLEDAARTYCESPRYESPYLEWSLINALLYVETIAFAQTLLSTRKLFGMTVPEPLKKPDGWQQFRKGTWLWAKALVLEGIKLAVTVGAAIYLSGDDKVVFWLIVIGVTGIRYLRPTTRQPEFEQQLKARQLLGDMSSAHNLLKTTEFNARLLRDQLYRLESRGAVFSPWVYHLLDRRIAREIADAKL